LLAEGGINLFEDGSLILG